MRNAKILIVFIFIFHITLFNTHPHFPLTISEIHRLPRSGNGTLLSEPKDLFRVTNVGSNAEWDPASVILMHTPGDELLFGLVHPKAGLFAGPFSAIAAAEEHREYIARLYSQHQEIRVIQLKDVLLEGTLDSKGKRLEGPALDDLINLASESLTYDTANLSEGMEESQEEYKEYVLRHLNPYELVRIILERPTVHLLHDGTNTGLKATYEMDPVNNILYFRDQMITTAKGVVIGRMNSVQREVETKIVKFALSKLGIVPIYEIKEGHLEGGDYLSAGDTAIIGQGLRTDAKAVQELLDNQAFGTSRVVVVKDSWLNQEEMHLDTYFNIIGPDLAVALDERLDAQPGDGKYLQVDVYELGANGYELVEQNSGFREVMEGMLGFRFIPVSKQDQLDYAINFLTVSPYNILAIEGASEEYKEALRAAGVNVHWMDFRNLTSGYGAAHCLTQVLFRESPAGAQEESNGYVSIEEVLTGMIDEVIQDKWGIQSGNIKISEAKKEFGDYSTNIAFLLKDALNMSPPEIAQEIAAAINEKNALIECNAVGPYVNFVCSDAFMEQFLHGLNELLSEGVIEEPSLVGKKVNLEYVSANPTGPLHVGHGRWAVLGSALANIFKLVGAEVYQEDYINDAGLQIEKLRQSIEAVAKGEPVPEGGYEGSYIADLVGQPGNPEDVILENHKAVLERLGVEFDRYFLESSLYEDGATERLGDPIGALRKQDLVYFEDGAWWVKTTGASDEQTGITEDVDRVIVKETGEPTYFNSDILYHRDKVLRGFDILINIWGSDHHGYVPRLSMAIEAVDPGTDFRVLLGQFVNLFRDGVPVRMSKRTGDIITLEELIDEIGVDATRYYLLSKSPNQTIEFDLTKAVEESENNPLHYIQYAHARACSVESRIAESQLEVKSSDTVSEMNDSEKELAKKLLDFPNVVRNSAIEMDPSLIVRYAHELAVVFNSFYSNCRVIDDDGINQGRANLVRTTRGVIKTCLDVLGVSAPEQM